MITLLVPVTSRGCGRNPEDQPILKALFPSLAALGATKYPMEIILGYDSVDPIWSDDKLRAEITRQSPHPIHSFELYALCGNMTAIWNSLVREAEAESLLRRHDPISEYFIPANDDLHFLTDPTVSLDVLRERGNFGTVSFDDRWMPGFPTFYLCHVNHLALFNVLYPLPWKGAHQDPWIYNVYRPWGALHDERVKVENRCHVAGARYDYGPATDFVEQVMKGRRRVNAVLARIGWPEGVIPVLNDADLLSTPAHVP